MELSKEQFWKAMSEPCEKECRNCIHRPNWNFNGIGNCGLCKSRDDPKEIGGWEYDGNG